MRNVPGLLWILGLFIPAASGLLLWNFLAAKPLPKAENVWNHVGEVARDIEQRRLTLAPGQSRDLRAGAYGVSVQRLADHAMPVVQARYVVRLQPKIAFAGLEPWVDQGAHIALVDSRPGAAAGEVRVVAIKRQKQDKI